MSVIKTFRIGSRLYTFRIAFLVMEISTHSHCPSRHIRVIRCLTGHLRGR